MLLSSDFLAKPKSINMDSELKLVLDEGRKKLWVNALIILGILYCQSNDQTRASVFIDVIKASLKD
jgi:hypothetical protein